MSVSPQGRLGLSWLNEMWSQRKSRQRSRRTMSTVEAEPRRVGAITRLLLGLRRKPVPQGHTDERGIAARDSELVLWGFVPPPPHDPMRAEEAGTRPEQLSVLVHSKAADFVTSGNSSEVRPIEYSGNCSSARLHGSGVSRSLDHATSPAPPAPIYEIQVEADANEHEMASLQAQLAAAVAAKANAEAVAVSPWETPCAPWDPPQRPMGLHSAGGGPVDPDLQAYVMCPMGRHPAGAPVGPNPAS